MEYVYQKSAGYTATRLHGYTATRLHGYTATAKLLPAPMRTPGEMSPEHFTHDDLQAALVAALQAMGCNVSVEVQVFADGYYPRSMGFADVLSERVMTPRPCPGHPECAPGAGGSFKDEWHRERYERSLAGDCRCAWTKRYAARLWEVKSSRERDVANAIRQLRGYSSGISMHSYSLALWLGFEPTANQLALTRAAGVELYVGWGDAAELVSCVDPADPTSLLDPLRRC